ncbi:sulfotransferase 1C2A-like [Pecten maximus]|uniref:sulfotransferase 1C2A-like n=1 Tax=Pecten maximus TaxID=6579 RepID=UPI0014588037|nr:sulfotransferase 1C2A-like [Pecten maximus]
MSDTHDKCPLPEYDGYLLPKFPPLVQDTDKRMTAIRDFKSEDTDILICTYPKTGSNWVYEIISMLVQGHATYLKAFKTIGMLEVSDLAALADMTSPRVLSTHVPFRHLPIQHLAKGCKVVHILRNPKDVTVSAYNQCKSPLVKHICDADEFPGTWDYFLRDFFENKHNFYDGFIKYEKDWEVAKRTKAVTNVYTMFYEDLRKNPIAEITRLAKYLEVPSNEELVGDIAEKCSFVKLQNAAETFKTDGPKTIVDGKNVLFRKGTVGDWKNWFTVAQNEQFDDYLDRELKGSTLEFKYEI